MLNDPEKSTNELLAENLALTREIYEHTKKTQRYILFGQIFTVVKIVLIVGPLIFAIIYLPPLLREAAGAYSELLGGGTGSTIIEGSSFVNQLFGGQ
ncbi:MAG: hypothetical protein HY462_01690 [Parcubacteria group bacterium]|nr:hypothetical protein [Parcubacteria group bacterium]